MSAKTQHESHAHSHGPVGGVAPVARRLALDTSLTGRGVAIAVLDSGFYPHPDLLEPLNRVLAYVDVSGAASSFAPTPSPAAWLWHGTQTSVVAAGSGWLSAGHFRGLACEADLVLVKVGDRGRITDDAIVRGLEWVLAHKDRFGIRVVTMSLGGDVDAPSGESAIDRAAEALVAAGVVVVAAAGNAGCTPRHRPVPPASSPSVIAVGGYDDGGARGGAVSAYCSSYGPTADGILKPDLVAPAAFVAAPILPNTDEYRRAAALSQIASTPDSHLALLDSETWDDARIARAELADGAAGVKALALRAIRDRRVVAAHYQHVVGTSFAAPIVASFVALMLEANPSLTPAAVRRVLVSTADRIPGVPAIRQGFGMLNAARALALAAREEHDLAGPSGGPPFCDGARLVFHFHDDEAAEVALAGDFNAWDATRHRFARLAGGLWRAEVPSPAPGAYRYKVVIDASRWVDDPANGFKEPDPFGGLNSVVSVGCEL